MIRFKLLTALFVLAASAASALADIQLVIEEPAAQSTKSGIGQITGWAVSDDDIISVEALIDGTSLGIVPYGGTRQDVAAAFPSLPDAEFSGWAMKWNYSLLEPGEHLLTIIATDRLGAQLSRDITFSTTAFKAVFIADPESVKTAGAFINSPEDGRIVITSAEVDGEVVDIELVWDTPSQQFLISKIFREEPAPQNLAPIADAGPNRILQTNESLQITGNGSDGDGSISSWRWQQVSGVQLVLQNTSSRTVRVTAPANGGEARLRLTVTDDDGATDSDDVIITIEEPAPPANQAPTANAGPDRTVDQGENVSITGSGSDPDGTITGWNWSQVSGPSVSLSGTGSQQVQFTAPESTGDIRLRLRVTDNQGATDTDDVFITVQAPPPPDNTTGETLASMLPVINAARGQARDCGEGTLPPQPPLLWSDSLAEIAKLHSMDMAREGYFSHTSIDGTTMGERVFPYWNGSRVGENIAASSITRTDSFVVDLWLNSPGHCKLIMDPNFTHAGIAAGHDSDNGFTYHHFWTLDFGG